MNSVLRVVDTPTYVSVNAVDKEFPLGVAEANPFYEEGWWWISRVKVSDRYQGYGIGSLVLMKLCEVLGKRNDIKGLVVSPGGYGSDVRRLEKFYMKHGFEKAEKGVLRWRPRRGSITGSQSVSTESIPTRASGSGA